MNTLENKKFYENLPEGVLQDHYAPLAGMHTCPDLNIIWRLHPGINTVLEIGAGEGRVISWILKHTHTSVTAIERCQNFSRQLRRKFENISRVTLIHEDVLRAKLPQADLVLLTWSGILEFSPDQQIPLIHKLRRSGKVCIEHPSEWALRLLEIEGDHGYTIRGTFPNQEAINALYPTMVNYRIDGKNRELRFFTATP